MTSPGATLAALRKDRLVVCAHCGQTFTAKDSRARFCSNRCRQADAYARGKKYRRKALTTETTPPAQTHAAAADADAGVPPGPRS